MQKAANLVRLRFRWPSAHRPTIRNPGPRTVPTRPGAPRVGRLRAHRMQDRHLPDRRPDLAGARPAVRVPRRRQRESPPQARATPRNRPALAGCRAGRRPNAARRAARRRSQRQSRDRQRLTTGSRHAADRSPQGPCPGLATPVALAARPSEQCPRSLQAASRSETCAPPQSRNSAPR